MKFIVPFSIAIATFAATPALGASFSVLCDNAEDGTAQKSCTIKLTGPIERGDAQKLLRIVRQPQRTNWTYSRLLLDSPGGNVAAALEIAAVVRQSLLYTATGRTVAAKPLESSRVESYSCVSACFLVWVAGAQRITTAFVMPRRTDGTSEIGLHRPYLEREAYERAPAQVAAMQQQVMQLTTEYLKREQVPQDLIEKMLSRASTQVHWVGPEDSNISGMSPWFEEMMIARCGFDPTKTEGDARYKAEQMLQRLITTGSLTQNTQAEKDSRERMDEASSQKYYACQQDTQASAQRAIRP